MNVNRTNWHGLARFEFNLARISRPPHRSSAPLTGRLYAAGAPPKPPYEPMPPGEGPEWRPSAAWRLVIICLLAGFAGGFLANVYRDWRTADVGLQANELGDAIRLSSALAKGLAERPIRTHLQAQTHLDALRRKRSQLNTVDAQIWLGTATIGLQIIRDELFHREVYESQRKEFETRSLDAALRDDEAEATRLMALAQDRAMLVEREEEKGVRLSQWLQKRITLTRSAASPAASAASSPERSRTPGQ